ncbi:MetQ/NlpA family ABC transporter substrate-binding protein [Corynebacterium pygosceleis]|uniref:MetQ/NlpA family ABC transporter substrate-binding protein n=1 Tax=Corynebacterium pygosceleis TaxID=2800406 RepID=A0A9Q4GIB7_9CORY|nr:MetQ/NlpA family ABC transporter substrate-binding protein [Corynebacterium pygosceleis]MCK7637605.1 MetQ/NlpA family ABC transporter substrate-binding protein [Corynebacterium pygosceleis]MCK7674796.1 MetQ/NlpA family ABC transporter substrate-binding protein [Corynebacterium pygosceleis]MCL0119615.1 MetQ/NlpA family ABC transporter substrate-binding protein [Corynebacterium pygosceleis]MCX7444856.1 MetQ/NlpA family ABC transporter substrate-binding protein [Corynebacterium pygosceleis]MCX
MNLRRFSAIAAAGLFTAGSLVACGSDSADSTGAAGEESTKVTIGTTDAGGKAWEVFEEEANKAGIDLEVVNYSDYNTPNKALSEGQIDANLFQHLKFLSEYNVGTGDDLTPVGSTEIVPLALFWKDHDSIDGIEGESVAIPNDSSNQGRAINVLVQAGLITLKEDGLITPTPADIDTEKSKVSVTPVAAPQTTTVFHEGKPAVINNTFLDRANIDPKSSVFADDPSSEEAEPYINAFVVRAEDADNENIQELVEIWQGDAVTDAVAEESKGTSVPVKRSAADLQEILKRLEDKLKNQ